MYRKVVLVDFSWLYNRYYFVAKQQYSEQDLPHELFRMLKEFFHRIESSYPRTKIISALDSATKSTGNFALNENYKQNRNKDQKKEVYKLLKGIVKDLASCLGNRFSFVKAKGFEADQVIAYLAKKYHEEVEVLIYSGDKDLLQLSAYSHVFISDKFKNGEFLLKSDQEIFDKFKNSKGEDFTRISTNKRDILKYRSLKGDSSDNLPPVFPRIRDSEIVSIIKEYWKEEEPLSESCVDLVIERLEVNNKGLADKLKKNKHAWITNYKIMSLYDISEEIEKAILKL